jgi:hypothetical protein
MSRSLALAGLLVDSWRDQSPQTESSAMNQPGSATRTSPSRGTPDDVPSTPRLVSLIVFGGTNWESR